MAAEDEVRAAENIHSDDNDNFFGISCRSHRADARDRVPSTTVYVVYTGSIKYFNGHDSVVSIYNGVKNTTLQCSLHTMHRGRV